MSSRRMFFKDEGGFTTAGAAVALLLVFALAFMGVRAYRVQERGSGIQYVADAGALAADNAVAEFVTLGQVADALLLSMSLLGLTAYAAAAVAAFVPGGQGVASKLASAASKVFKARDRAAKSAVKGLNAAQKALPAVCAARAASVIEANDAGGSCSGFAVPVPLEGIDYSLPDTSGADEAADELKEGSDAVAEAVERAQELQERMDASRRRAWLADCGGEKMSMYERAGHLASLSGAQNPYYTSPESWGFSVALQRSRHYYRARYEAEPGERHAGSPELVAESVARKRFYAYALDRVSKGAVEETEGAGELPRFEHLAANTAQVRETELYTEAVYPLSREQDKLTLHAYAGCPACEREEQAGLGSVSMVDAGSAAVCDTCKFSPKTLGRVPAASTSIDNGYEHYYRTVADEADAYRKLALEAQQVEDELRASRDELARAFRKGLESLKALRYDPQPPGRYGCICVVYGKAENARDLPFVARDEGAPARVAISGASLASDASSGSGDVISQIGENLVPQHVAGAGVVKGVFGAWGAALRFYSGANEGVSSILESALSPLPLVGTRLSSWAVSGFEKAAEKANLQPPKLDVFKPVLVNTAHIAARDDGPVSRVLLKMKSASQAYGDVSAGDLQALAQMLELPDGLADLLSDDGLLLMKIPLSQFGVPVPDAELRLPAPADLTAAFRALSAGAG